MKTHWQRLEAIGCGFIIRHCAKTADGTWDEVATKDQA